MVSARERDPVNWYQAVRGFLHLHSPKKIKMMMRGDAGEIGACLNRQECAEKVIIGGGLRVGKLP